VHGYSFAHDSLLGMALLVVKLCLQTECLALELSELVRGAGLLLPLPLKMVQPEAMALLVEFDIVSLRHGSLLVPPCFCASNPLRQRRTFTWPESYRKGPCLREVT